MTAKLVRQNMGAKLVVSVRNPRASITFTNATGTQIFIDSSSKDQWFVDTLNFTESLNFNIGLTLSDSIAFVDSIEAANFTNKSATESVSFSENVVIGQGFGRAYSDSFGFSDSQALGIHKVVSDSISFQIL